MTKKEISEKIILILQETCEIRKDLEVNENSHLQDDLELDSIGILTLASEIENQFKIILPANEEEIPHTVGELGNYIFSKIDK